MSINIFENNLMEDIITALLNAGVKPKELAVTLASIANNCDTEEEVIKAINSFGKGVPRIKGDFPSIFPKMIGWFGGELSS